MTLTRVAAGWRDQSGSRDLPGDGRSSTDEARHRRVLPRGRRGDHAGGRAAASRRSSAGRRGCTRGSSSRRGRKAMGTLSSKSAFRAGRRSGYRRRESTSRRAGMPTRSVRAELAVAAWAAQMGTITFHPWPVRAGDVDHPMSCSSTWTRRRAPTSATRCGSPRRHAGPAG